MRITFPCWVFLLLLLPLSAEAEWQKESRVIMGTRIHAEVWHTDPGLARRGLDAVFREMQRIDEQMSPYKDNSELSLLNREAASRAVPVSQELFQLVKQSMAISRLSSGAFDITFASVGRLYDYRKGVAPNQQQLDTSLPAINYRHLQLDEQKQTIRYLHPGVKIDLGGIAKGHAVDNCIVLLQGMGISRAIVTAGGDSRIIGDKLGRPWMIGIQAPRQKKQSAVVLPLSDTAISTSGDYERYFIRDGVRHHHIISPATGKSVRELQSVSVIGPDATTTDALSTTVFVLGREKGMALVESLPGIEAVLIDGHSTMHYSSGLGAP